MKKLIEQYNHKDTILVVSSYPEQGVTYSGKVCAVGSYTKNTLKALDKERFVVLTVATGDAEEIYEEENVLVWRVFRRNSIFSYLKLWYALSKFSRIQKAIVSFEFASFGNTLTTALFPSVLLLLRVFRKKTILILHQVVKDTSSLAGHLGWNVTERKVRVFNLLLRAFLFALTVFPQTIVVLEEFLKNQLVSLVGMSEKIVVIPHGVDTSMAIIDKQTARKKLGIDKNTQILLYFGYLTWYKGVDFLAKTAIKPFTLIIAGGESATQKNKRHYQEFVHAIYETVKNSNCVTITGFVEEKDIPFYFAASDLVLLPYRTFMSSSGPLSFVFAFQKPFLMSSHLEPYFQSPDFALALSKVGLSKEDVLFTLENKSFSEKIKDVFSKGKLQKMTQFSRKLAAARDFSQLARSYTLLL